jgi:DNA-binding transcriptional MocR family regulator
MILVRLEKQSPVPLFKQIVQHLTGLMDEGRLQPGDRLPPTRELGATLGVHRSTVVRAYEEIRALGYLESRAGSFTTVRRRLPLAGIPEGSGQEAYPWAEALPEPILTPKQTQSEVRDIIDFSRLAADPSLTPQEDLRGCMRRAMIRHGQQAFDYNEPMGWRPLREILARHLVQHGIAAGADQIAIVGGAQHGLDLIMRLMLKPGDGVVVEAPTYGLAHPLLRLHGARVLEVPMTAQGMDLEALARVLAGKTRPRLIYTMPTFHNPTGITTDQAHREALFRLCQDAGVPIIEDGFEEELKYFGRAVLPLKSMDRSGLVLYVGSFSKVVFPGLRVGWVAAPEEVVERLAALHQITSLGGGTLNQAAAALFARDGGLDRHLRKVHRVYRGRMEVLLAGLNENLGEGATWTVPAGGYTLWLELPGDDEATWMKRMAEEGVLLAPGSQFFAGKTGEARFRVSIACADEQSIREGCRRLGKALRS